MSLVLLAYAASRMHASNKSLEMVEAAKREAGTTYYFGEDAAGRPMARVKATDPEYANFARIHTFQVGNNQPQKIPDKPFTPQKVYYNKNSNSFTTNQEYILDRQAGRVDSAVRAAAPQTKFGPFIGRGPNVNATAGPAAGEQVPIMGQIEFPGATSAEQFTNMVTFSGDAIDRGFPHVGFTKPEGGYELFDNAILKSLGVIVEDKGESSTYSLDGKPFSTFAEAEKAWMDSDRTKPLRQVDKNGKVSVAIAGVERPEEFTYVVGGYTTNNPIRGKEAYEKDKDAGLYKISSKTGDIETIHEAKVQTEKGKVEVYYGDDIVKSVAEARKRYQQDNTKEVFTINYDPDGTVKSKTVLFAEQDKPDPKKTEGFEYTVSTPSGSTVTFRSELRATEYRNKNNPTAKIEKRKVEYEDDMPVSIGEMSLLKPEAKKEGQTEEIFDPNKKKYVPFDEFMSSASQEDVEKYQAGNLKRLIRNDDGTVHKYIEAKSDTTGKSKNAAKNASDGIIGVTGKFLPNDNETEVKVGYPADSKFGVREQVDHMVIDYYNRPEVFKNMEAMITGDAATRSTAYDQWVNLLANRVVALHAEASVDPATGMKISAVADLINPIDDYAFQVMSGLENIPGIREALERAFDVKTQANRTADQSEISRNEGTNTVIPQEIKYTQDGRELKFVAQMPFPDQKHGPTLEALRRVGVLENNIPNFVSYKTSGLGREDVIKYTRSGEPYRVMDDFHYRLNFIDRLESMPVSGGGTQLDTFVNMLTPHELRANKSQISTLDRAEISNEFMIASTRPGMIPGTVVRDPQGGMDIIMNLVPLSDTTSEKMFRRVYAGKNMQDVISGAQQSAGAATQAFQTLLNIEASYFMPDPETGLPSNRMINMTMTEAKLISGVDGLLYFVNKGVNFIQGKPILEIKDAVGVAESSYSRAMALVMSPEEAEKAGRGSAEANRKARENNRRILDGIMADLGDDSVAENGVAKNILATRKLYMYLAAYQMAAAIQGGTGGRTISDQDVENMLNAFNFDGITTPQKELAAVRAAKSMMLRISVIDSAIGNGSPAQKHAALKYQELERSAGDPYRVTIYNDINAAASYLRMDGAGGTAPDTEPVEVAYDAGAFGRFVATQPNQGGAVPSGIGTAEKAKAKFPELYEQFMKLEQKNNPDATEEDGDD